MIGPFYVYLLSHPDGTPVYVGKGKDARMEEHEKYRTHNCALREIIADLKFQDLSLIKTKLHDGLAEDKAYELEAYEIARIGRRQFGVGPLVNRTDGGDQPRRIVFSDEHRAKLSAAKRGRRLPESHKAKIAASGMGRVVSQETRAKLSKINLGKKKVWREGSYERFVELQRQNNPGHTGHRHTAETKQRIREAATAQAALRRSKSAQALTSKEMRS